MRIPQKERVRRVRSELKKTRQGDYQWGQFRIYYHGGPTRWAWASWGASNGGFRTMGEAIENLARWAWFK